MYIPSGAINNSLRVLNLYGSLKWTTANGAPRPGSWIISYKNIICINKQTNKNYKCDFIKYIIVSERASINISSYSHSEISILRFITNTIIIIRLK